MNLPLVCFFRFFKLLFSSAIIMLFPSSQGSCLIMERRYHQLSDGRKSFSVESRYTTLTPAGRVTKYTYMPQQYYSTCQPVVVSDTETDVKYIIECHFDTFNDALESKQLLAEARFGKLCIHPNIHSICEVMLPDPSSSSFDSVLFVKPHMDTSLHRAIYSTQKLGIDHARFFLYQLLCGLNYLSSAGIVHQDICPQNILVNANCDIRIAGLNFHYECSDEGPMEFDYHRRFRAYDYDFAGYHRKSSPQSSLDVWSAGCVFEAILNSAGQSTFSNLDTMIEHLKKLFAQLGRPSDEDIDAEDSYIQNDAAKRFVKKLPMRTTPPSMAEICPQFAQEEEAADLLFKMLCLDSRQRISIRDALAHPFFYEYYDLADREPLEQEQDAGFQFDVLPSMTLDGLVDESDPLLSGAAFSKWTDQIKSLWWQDFYRRDPNLPPVYPGHVEFVAEMNWKNRKGFLLFLYRARFLTLPEPPSSTYTGPGDGRPRVPVATTEDPDLFPDGVPFALCAVFQNSDLVRFLLQFV